MNRTERHRDASIHAAKRHDFSEPGPKREVFTLPPDPSKKSA